MSDGGQGRHRVLVVDDEPALREALENSLTFEGYDVTTASDGAEALRSLAQSPVDLVVLDVLMPNTDGLTACRHLRSSGSTVPILMLTARDTVGDRVTGLDAGADDYLVKPFDLDELIARMRALLRRVPPQEGGQLPLLEFADLTMDTGTREVRRAGRTIALTRTEFTLLELFLRHPRQVLSREQILRSVWGFDFTPHSNPVEVYMMYLRRKTEPQGLPRLLHTVRGVGYVLRETAP